jgi:hypothetical protein
MSSDLELEQIRFRVKSLEAQLLTAESELDRKRIECVSLTVAIKRQNGPNAPPASVPSIQGLEASYDTVNDLCDRDSRAWERVRGEFFRVVDERDRLKAALALSEESLREERERRFRDIERLKQLLFEKENEIKNYKEASDLHLKKSIELEDKLAKARSYPSTACSTARSTSPPPPSAQVFSRNYFSASPPSAAMTSYSLPGSSPYGGATQSIYASPVLLARQIVPSSHIYRRGSS